MIFDTARCLNDSFLNGVSEIIFLCTKTITKILLIEDFIYLNEFHRLCKRSIRILVGRQKPAVGSSEAILAT